LVFAALLPPPASAVDASCSQGSPLFATPPADHQVTVADVPKSITFLASLGGFPSIILTCADVCTWLSIHNSETSYCGIVEDLGSFSCFVS
jgi:hypothetical protein